MGATSRYLAKGESLVHVSRRHTVVLGNSMVLLVVAVAIAVALGVESHRWPADHLSTIGALVGVVGAVYFGWRLWHWWLTRYVITSERIMLIEGLVARQIKSLPLRLVIDTTYHRSVGGRIFGYCDLELNLSGQPGLRKLTTVPHADRVYKIILGLLSAQQGPKGATAAPAGPPAPAAAPVDADLPVDADETGELPPVRSKG